MVTFLNQFHKIPYPFLEAKKNSKIKKKPKQTKNHTEAHHNQTAKNQ